MAERLEPFKISGLGVFGVIREAEVDDDLLPDQAVVEALNVHFDSKGRMTVRPGLTAIQSSAIVSGTTCLGLYQFNYSSGSAVLTVFSDNKNDIYTLSGTTWSKSWQDDTGGAKTRFITFSNYLVKMNGADTMMMYNGTAWTGSGNPLNLDDLSTQGGHSINVKPKFGEVFKSKVYVSGDSTNPDRLYYSSVITSAGNITWTPLTNYVDINPNDGENITGLKRWGTILSIFKPNAIYRYFGIEGTDPDPMIGVGTRSHESIVSAKDGLYFHHDSGFYKYAGGQPSEISKPISDFIDAIPSSYYADITGWKDSDHVYWSVGDLTVGGVSFKNIVCRYTISSQIWTIYSYASELRYGTDYNNGATIIQIVGDDNGQVYKFNTGLTDNGTSIGYRLITKWYESGGIFNTKVLQDFVAICEKAQGMELMYQVDEDTAFKSIGQLRKYLTVYTDKNITFHRIRFKVTGMSSSEAPIFKGIWILRGIVEGLLDNQ